MKDAPLHSYPWYVADWRGSETRLTLPISARYIFRELLDYCWIEGSIPSDEQSLARIASVETKEFKAAWPLVKGKFVELDGRLTHWRVIEKRPKLQHWANSRVKGGETGGKSKAANQAKPKAIASRELEVDPLPPLTPSLPSVKRVTAPATRANGFELMTGPDPQAWIAETVEGIATFWPIPGNVPRARVAAEHEWAKSQTAVTEWGNTITLSANRWADYHRAARASNGKHYIPTIERWLTDGDYARKAPGVANSTSKRAPACERCHGAGTINSMSETDFRALLASDEDGDVLTARIDAAKVPCPACQP